MNNQLKNLTRIFIAMALLAGAATPVMAQVSIGINLSVYPDFVRVPDYPVYYAPQLRENYFFYDGMYWVYERDQWYSSTWYDGPWWLTEPEFVPYFILRIPVRYYRSPPSYFRGWVQDSPPRWGDHWGSQWQQRRSGWDQWDRRVALAPAPLPIYQRQYSGDRYPRADQQRVLLSQNYRYQPQDAAVRQRFVRQTAPVAAPAAVPQRQPQPQRAPEARQQPQQVQPQRQPTPEARQQPQPEPQGKGKGNGNGQDNGKGQNPDQQKGGRDKDEKPGRDRKY